MSILETIVNAWRNRGQERMKTIPTARAIRGKPARTAVGQEHLETYKPDSTVSDPTLERFKKDFKD